MNLKEQLDAAKKAAQAIVDGAKAAGREMSDEDRAAFTKHLDEAKGLKAQIERAEADEKALADLAGMGVKADVVKPVAQVNEPAPARSLGEHFVKSNAYADARARVGERFSVSAPEYKAVGAIRTDTGATSGLTQTQYGRVVPINLHRPVIADLLSAGTVEQPTLQYFVQNAPTDASTTSAGLASGTAGGFAAVAEAGSKPQVGWGFGTQTEHLKKIAGWYQISDEALEDLPYITSVIDSQLLLRLALEEERQLLNGDSASGGVEVKGILQRGISTATAASGALGNADAIFQAMTKITSDTGLSADGLVLNPVDYQRLRLGRDANSQYFGGGYLQGQYGVGGLQGAGMGAFEGGPNVWGLRTVVTPGIPAGTVLVGNFQLGGQVLRKGGVRVDTTNTDQDDFVKNLVKVRAECRLMLAIYYPAAFVNVSVS